MSWFRSQLRRPSAYALLVLLFYSAAWAVDTSISQAPTRHYHPAEAPSFDCSETGSPVQDFICASDVLAALDREATDLHHKHLRTADMFGRDQLLAGQRRWLRSRISRCAVPAARPTADQPDAAISACLENDYREHITSLKQWQPATRTMRPDSDHPLSAYIQFATAESLDATLCEHFGESMNAAIKREGEVNVARISGAKLIAGSHGNPVAQQPMPVSIILRDAGPYGSYEMRATGMQLGASIAIDKNSIGRWIGEQPNNGGRPSDLSSQTNDYGALDVFSMGGSLFALVTESWGYYTPAASGESAYAGLYVLDGGSARRRCLFKIYMRPPVRSAFDGLLNFTALFDALEAIRATEPSGFDVSARRDEYQLRREQEWQLLNLPLMQTIQAKQYGWTGWLRRRHDTTLDRLFLWSEGSLLAKQLYRTLLPTLKPAMAEVAQTLNQTQGLTAEEAAQATDLLAMELIDHSIGPVVDNSEAYTQSPSTLVKYKPRFPVLPERADLEKGRPVATLYATVINRLPAKAVSDFIAWEAAHPEKRSFGRNGETALMASVLVPDHVALLLAAGANPNEADRFGFTPLMLAARHGRNDSIAQLLTVGAKIEMRTLDQPTEPNEATEVRRVRIGGKTALHFAALYGDATTVHALLNEGARADGRDNFGTLPCDALKLNMRLSDVERRTLSGKLCLPELINAPGDPARRSDVVGVQADFFTAARPALQVGDRWKVEKMDKNTNALRKTDEVVVASVLPDQIKLSINGRPGVMTPDLILLDDTILRCDRGFQMLSFPLYVGKKWSFKTNWEHTQRRSAGRGQMEVVVKGDETVKLSWGEVPALRLEAQGTINVESPIRLNLHVSVRYWYAPSVRAIVRTEWNDGVEDSISEVVGFTLAPQ